MKIGNICRLRGKNDWGRGREKVYAECSNGDPLVRIADLKQENTVIRVVDPLTPNTPEDMRDNYSVSSWLDLSDADLEFVREE